MSQTDILKNSLSGFCNTPADDGDKPESNAIIEKLEDTFKNFPI
jgi:hypothetical protein